jgi:hypothetical protein
VGDVVGCIFELESSVGGFLILKQIIVYFLIKEPQHRKIELTTLYTFDIG